MSVFIAIILGLTQGLCEFLPVSSSGHLLLMQKAFGVSDGGYFFSIMLHLATLAAVIIVYRRRIWELIRHPFQWQTLWIIVATAVTVVMSFALRDIIDSAAEGRFLGYAFLVTALFLVISEAARSKLPMTRACSSMKWYHSAFIGFIQGIAILPGISRSGSTITGATLCGLDRSEAAEFSFLLSIPAILGGAVLEIPEALSAGMSQVQWLPMAIGMLAAGVSGYFAVRFMIRLITKRSLAGFAVYTAILGAFIILDQNVFHIIAW